MKEFCENHKKVVAARDVALDGFVELKFVESVVGKNNTIIEQVKTDYFVKFSDLDAHIKFCESGKCDGKCQVNQIIGKE